MADVSSVAIGINRPLSSCGLESPSSNASTPPEGVLVSGSGMLLSPPHAPEFACDVEFSHSNLALSPEDQDSLDSHDQDKETITSNHQPRSTPPLLNPASVHLQSEKKGSKRANSVSSDAERGRFKPRLNAPLFAAGPLDDGVIEGDDALHSSYRSGVSHTSDTEAEGNFSPATSWRYGLKHSGFKTDNSIKIISANEACEIIKAHYSSEMPEVEKMFPWLHGMSRKNFAQLRFLKGKSWDDTVSDLPVNCKKSLTVVQSCTGGVTFADTGKQVIKGAVSANEILTCEMGSNLEYTLAEVMTYLDSDQMSYDQLLSDCIKTGLLPVFQDLDPPMGVSLRNFHIQVAKLGLLSDFIVYCTCSDHTVDVANSRSTPVESCRCAPISRLLHVAQIRQARIAVCEYLNEELGSKTMRAVNTYDTMIVKDVNMKAFAAENLLSLSWQPSSLNEKSIESSGYDKKVFEDWESNYIYREKLEISKMSRATYVSSNVWFGNSADFESFKDALSHNSKSFFTGKVSPGFHNPPLHCDPTNTIVNLTKTDVESLEPQALDDLLRSDANQRWGLCIHCGEGFKFPKVSDLEGLFDQDNGDSTYIEFPSSGSVSLGDCTDGDLCSLINVCKLLYYKCSLSSSSPGLIFCFDGYTETSLLGICFLIYAENMRVDDAIVKLHKQYGRPVFLFKTDYLFLTRVESLLRKFSPYGQTMEEQCANMKAEKIDSYVISSVLLAPSKNNVGISYGDMENSVSNSFDRRADLYGPKVQHSTVEVESGSESSSNEEDVGCCASVYGSLPSRILPHLYLGSLVHAANLDLLNELGITRVVSVGECIPWVDDLSFSASLTPSNCEILTVEPYQRTSTGRLCQVKQVMGIGNINDDGIGTLTTTINDALDFIQQAYANNEKVLVHCQVGVSRSATVCIAETMKRLNISLPRAYLYVRVRRLNVIIQPNLKLMYELFKWEETFVKSKRDLAEKRRKSVASTVSNASIFSQPVDRKASIATSFGSISSIAPRRSVVRSRKISNDEGKPIKEESALMSEDDESDAGFVKMTESETISSVETVPHSTARSMVTFNTESFSTPALGFEDSKDDFSKLSAGMKFDNDADYDIAYDTGDTIISNNPSFLREVDWNILCREIHKLNKAYIYSA
ncbi:unnamed protein product [Kuraishia capsulata CBS 1993]|uniref:Uncharacterized protein n=1 Tax=Kuraishia capsulata CBS 1993 TaxID=1382522 RepID=W6MKM4_9ASCO|nr:uncharacterized protein KUCA_T00003016001 [Kuraishia capsulata CBS 1993]CDK27039.1 unnamed protein product [Kuraishia capsulata CBS 1993]